MLIESLSTLLTQPIRQFVVEITLAAFQIKT